MRIWRICRKPFARTPLDGRGGLVAEGRWHTPRRLVVYASESLALASLEVLVHCDIDLLPSDLMAIEIEVPSGLPVHELKTDDLPRVWRKHPAPRTLQEAGNRWLDEGSSALLRVPSALVPPESNYLINPLHPAFGEIQVLRRFKFTFDPRLTVRKSTGPTTTKL
jgi:RES domain-containing protein